MALCAAPFRPKGGRRNTPAMDGWMDALPWVCCVPPPLPSSSSPWFPPTHPIPSSSFFAVGPAHPPPNPNPSIERGFEPISVGDWTHPKIACAPRGPTGNVHPFSSSSSKSTTTKIQPFSKSSSLLRCFNSALNFDPKKILMPSPRQKSAFPLPSIAQFFPLLLQSFILFSANGQAPFQSPECKKAAEECENATDCVHRLAVLQSACVTNTCQPQCREAALNLYQNREGRALLRTDASCVPGRYELEKCGFLPNKLPKHCSLAKLICETDLQCNAKWEVFMSECEADTNSNDLRRCSEKCRRHLNATLATQNGAALATCTCTDKEDGRCTQLRDLTIHSCLGPAQPEDEEGPLPRPGTISGEGSREENGDLDSNGISGTDRPPVHSQSDVPDGAIGQGRTFGWVLLVPSILLAIIAALALR